MSQWEFYKRRLVRLQPMVIMGSIIGALLFYFQAGSVFSLIADTPAWKLIVMMLIGFTMIPVTKNLDIRGWKRNVSGEWPGLVAVLRIHRKHSLRPSVCAKFRIAC